MIYLLCVALVVVAAVLVIIGAATVSATPYIGGAILSGLAVILLWRRVKGGQENVFVTDPPQVTQPQWDRPIRRAASQPLPEGIAAPTITIPGYEDLVAAEVLPSLETLSVDELQAVILYERSGMARQAIIRRAEVLIDLTLGTGSAQRMIATAVKAPEAEVQVDVQVVDEPTVVAEPEMTAEAPVPAPEKPKRVRKPKSKDPDLSI